MVVILDEKNAAPNLTSDEIVNTVTQILLTDDKFANELERWCETHCDRFFLDDESEHLMEHWKLHEDFCNLFVLMRGRKWCLRLVAAETPSTRALTGPAPQEKRIESCLTENGYSVDEFWDALMKFVDGQKGATGAEGFLLEALRASTDYRQFAVTRRQMRRDRSGK